MIRIGLAGCGRWGRLILRDLKSLGCWVAVAAITPLSVANAEAGMADAIVASIEDFPEVDAFVVAVVTAAHGEVMLRLAARGVPIFCEKPLTNNADAARQVVAAAGEQVFVMDKWRYHPGIHALRDLAHNAELGPVLGIKTTRLQWGLQHADVDLSWIMLPHDLTIALEILGYLPQPAHAIAESDEEGVFGLSAWLTGPAWLQCEVGIRFPQYKRTVELRCRDGVAMLGDSYDQYISVMHTNRGARRGNAPEWQKRPFADSMPLLAELAVFVAYVEGKGPAPKSSAVEGLQVVETIAGLRRLAGLK